MLIPRSNNYIIYFIFKYIYFMNIFGFNNIKDAIIKMVSIDILNTSFRMDELPTGGIANLSESKKIWQEDIDRCVENRREVFVIP